MENLESQIVPDKIHKLPEICILTARDRQKIDTYFEHLRRERNPHWESIDPDKLEGEDFFVFKKIYIDKEWSDEDQEFKDYAKKIINYADSTYGDNFQEKWKDSRYNLYAFLQNYLVGMVGLKKREKKLEERKKTIH